MQFEEQGSPRIMNEEHQSGARGVGFDIDLLGDDPEPKKKTTGSGSTPLITQLIAERQVILSDPKLSSKERLRLLESNRQTIVVAAGGSVKKTENVVYSILVFGGVVIIVLSLLTVFGGLPSEVTLAFVGTVLGGVIATIAQKLGKI